jgi:hypothetical protein
MTDRYATAASMDTAAWKFSGEIRERATCVSAIDFDGSAPETGLFWTQRLRLTADYRDSEYLASRVTFLSALQAGLEANPVEQNLLDLQEVWLQVNLDSVAIRVGRQELVLGSQRLAGLRDGTNVPRNWDGARALIETVDWRVEDTGSADISNFAQVTFEARF